MSNKVIVLTVIALVGVLFVCLFVYLVVPSSEGEPSEITQKKEFSVVESKDKAFDETKNGKLSETDIKDEPTARALYEKMIETMRNAASLSYTSKYQFAGRNPCTYKIWMRKPNYFRVETINDRSAGCGTLIGDGDFLWIYWPGNRPHFSREDQESYDKTKSQVYMKEATPLARHSIGHKTGLLGAGMSMPIIDPSTFHGYTDSLQRYLDGVRMIGTEKVEEEECDVIEVSIMKGQRIWQLWLSKQDHLPRKLKQIIHVSRDIITHERWTEVTINAEISIDKFAWTPPEDWRQWRLPDLEESLLKPGQGAPDFKLTSVDGSTIKLSDYYGKVVWFYIWRAG
jgi:outer membrane lipoprotein-sorting protein